MKLTGVQGNVLAMRTRTAFRMSLRASGQGCASLASLWMSLRASAWGPRKGAPFAGKGATRERCPAPASGRSRAWRTLGRRGVAICIPAVTQDNEQYFRQIRNRLRICPGRTLLQTLTPYKFLHVIARSEATGQSVLPAVGHDREQCLRRIRKSATNLPQRQQACPLSLRGCGLPQVCALVRNDMLKEGRVRGGKNVARNDIHRLGGLAHTRSRAQCTTRFSQGTRIVPSP